MSDISRRVIDSQLIHSTQYYLDRNMHNIVVSSLSSPASSAFSSSTVRLCRCKWSQRLSCKNGPGCRSRSHEREHTAVPFARSRTVYNNPLLLITVESLGYSYVRNGGHLGGGTQLSQIPRRQPQFSQVEVSRGHRRSDGQHKRRDNPAALAVGERLPASAQLIWDDGLFRHHGRRW